MDNTGDYAWMGPLENLEHWLRQNQFGREPTMLICCIVGRDVIVPVGLRVKRQMQDPWMSVALELTNAGGGRVIAANREIFYS